LADVAGVQKLSTFVDSAWLRYDLPAGHPERVALGSRDRVLIERVGLDEDVSGVAVLRRGWFVLEGSGGDDPFGAVEAAVGRLRTARARAAV
jgi:hypothetical protein